MLKSKILISLFKLMPKFKIIFFNHPLLFIKKVLNANIKF